MADSLAADLVGTVLDDRYRLDALIGEGGMGAVFRATHLAMDRRVAVKLLKPHLTSDETHAQRFLREARSTLRVDSPHAVKVLDFGVTPQRDYYMVLEYLDGRTVQRELDVDGPFAPARAVHAARQALHALGAAHRQGLVHRDIKPDNLLLMRVGADPDYTKVLDFGVAKLMEGVAPRTAQSALALTQIGMVFGTPEFMSPEQACGQPLDGRSDLYSLAATVFAMLTGCGLFESGPPIEWLTNHVRTPPPHLATVIPELAAYPELDALLQRCLAKQRERRPRDAEEMERLLGELAPTLTRPAGASPPARVAGAGGSRPTGFSSSSFLDALPQDPGATLLPPQAGPESVTTPGHKRPAPPAAPEPAASAPSIAVPVPSPARPAQTEAASALPRQRAGRGLLLAVGAIVIVAMVGGAIGLALTRRGARTAEPPIADALLAGAGSSDAAPSIDAIAPLDAAAAAVDAPPAPVDGAVPAQDAGPRVRTSPDAGARPPAGSPEECATVTDCIKKAKEALAQPNRILYLRLSELAHQKDPRNQQAALMYGEALLLTGNKEPGCKQLRALKRVPAAQEMARSAECPAD